MSLPVCLALQRSCPQLRHASNPPLLWEDHSPEDVSQVLHLSRISPSALSYTHIHTSTTGSPFFISVFISERPRPVSYRCHCRSRSELARASLSAWGGTGGYGRTAYQLTSLLAAAARLPVHSYTGAGTASTDHTGVFIARPQAYLRSASLVPAARGAMVPRVDVGDRVSPAAGTLAPGVTKSSGPVGLVYGHESAIVSGYQAQWYTPVACAE